MGMQRFAFILLIPKFCLLAGCGTTSNLRGEEQGKSIDLAPYNHLLVEDFTDDATARVQGYKQLMLKPRMDGAIKDFPDRIADAVRSSGGFASVERAGTPGASTLILRGAIHQLDDGDESLRKIFGFWAGNTNLAATLQLVDGGTGDVLGSWTVDRYSFSVLGEMMTPTVGKYSHAPTPEAFMQEAARKIAGELTEGKRRGQITAID